MRKIRDKALLVFILSMAMLIVNMKTARADVLPDPDPLQSGFEIFIIALVVIVCIFIAIYIIWKIKDKTKW
ncbi:MAG: hypothetical protein Q8930_10590 [Bacillota bacterium]|nr:hypothetical protein [Bacillota bacterium]